MTNDQIQERIKAHQAMIGEYVSSMNPLAGGDDPDNLELSDLLESCEAEIYRLTRTLEVRKAAAKMRGRGEQAATNS